MNAFSWMRHVRPDPVLSRPGKRWISFFGPILARILGAQNARIVVRPVPDGFTAHLHMPYRKRELQVHWQERAGCWQPDAAFGQMLNAARERLVDLILPSDLILTQTVKLPAAALSNLSEAIAYGLPSWSPFDTDEVYVKGDVDEVQAGQATVRLCYALKAKVDPLLARLDAIGLPADRLVLDFASTHSVTLSTPKVARLQKARRIDGALAIVAISLVLLLGSLRIMVLSQRYAEAETLLRAELVQFRQAETLQTAYAAFAAQHSAVSERRARNVGAYELLLALAEHLPDGALIQALDVERGRGQIELSGVDPDTALRALRLIPVFQSLKSEPARGPGSVTLSFGVKRKTP